MTSRERLMSIFRGEIPDRPAVKLWGCNPGRELLHPDYEPVYKLAMELADLVYPAGSPLNLQFGYPPEGIINCREEATDSPEWIDSITEVQTPQGLLRGVMTVSTCKKAGYTREHLCKEPPDLLKVLSVPYQPHPFEAPRFQQADHDVGDRGIPLFGLDHAAYALQRLSGSQNLALWSRSHRRLLLDVVGEFSDRRMRHVRAALENDISGVFGWVGPEVFIPPLMSPKDFDDFCIRFDKPLIDLLHEKGNYVWVHCHGKMGPVLEGFLEMGVDVLNPIEPPPMGDITLEEAFKRVGNRMGLEGNIETHETMVAPRERMEMLIKQALEAGRGRRFILCQSSGYMETPEPTGRHIENLMTYVEEGVRLAEAMTN